jgi:hypothetical protein
MKKEAINIGWRHLDPLVKTLVKWQASRLASDHDIHAPLLPTFEALKITHQEANKKHSSKQTTTTEGNCEERARPRKKKEQM